MKTANEILEEILSPEDFNAAGNIKFFKNQNNKIFVNFRINGVYETNELKSDRFKNWLISCTGNTHVNSIISRLTSAVYMDRTISELNECKRVAYYNGNIYLDLANDDRQIVKIDENAFYNEGTALPVLFAHYSTMRPLPIPEVGGSLEMLREFINVDDNDFRILLGWLIAALNPAINCPILFCEADSGTGKTTMMNFLKSLIDPDASNVLTNFRSSADFYAIAASRYVIGLDNLSSLSKQQSDLICQTVTGAGATKRKLGTDNEAYNITLHNPMIISGINLGAVPEDLQDRCFKITMRGWDAKGNGKKSDSSLQTSFNEKRSKILGALLQAVSAALANKSYVCVSAGSHRMSDAIEFIMKAANAGALPFTEEEFEKTLLDKKSAMSISKINDNPVARAVYDMVEDKAKTNTSNNANADSGSIQIYKGLTSQLLDEIVKFAKDNNKPYVNDMPKSNRGFGKKLAGVRNILREQGIEVTQDPTNRAGTMVTINYISCEKVENVENVEAGISKVDNAITSQSTEETPHEVSATNNSLVAEDISDEKSPEIEFLTPEAKKIQYPLFLSAISGLQCNSGVPLANLIQEGINNAVLSNARFPAVVTKNTLIWENWDIFSHTDYAWAVVIRHPECVKTWIQRKCKCFVVRPYNKEKERDKYSAVSYSNTGSLSYISRGPVSLEEAVHMCENNIYTNYHNMTKPSIYCDTLISNTANIYYKGQLQLEDVIATEQQKNLLIGHYKALDLLFKEEAKEVLATLCKNYDDWGYSFNPYETPLFGAADDEN